MGTPSREIVLLVAFGEIHYKIVNADPAWRARDEDFLYCVRCEQQLVIFGPNALHSVPLGCCACNAAFLQPLDSRDAALLELAVSEKDKNLGARFRQQLSKLVSGDKFHRLTATVSPEGSNERTS